MAKTPNPSADNGVWRSLVAHLLWEQRVAGSNPVSPTKLEAQRISKANPQTPNVVRPALQSSDRIDAFEAAREAWRPTTLPVLS